MKTPLLAIICAILLMILGINVIIGWVFHIPAMVQLFPGLVAMVFNTAFLFFLSGLLLIIINFGPFPYSFFLQRLICIFIIIVASLSLSQDIFRYESGIDKLIITPWLEDPNPTPGRMAPNTSIGFILTGLVGLLLPYARKPVVGIVIQAATFMILLIGLVGLLVYSLKLEFILDWYQYTRMAVHTAIGFLIISTGWLATWSNQDWFINFYRGREDKKIVFLTAIILFCLTLVAGLGSVAALTYMNISSVHQSLQTTLQHKNDLFKNTILNVESNLSSTLSNPELLEAIIKENSVREKTLERIAKILTNQGFSAIQYKNSTGQLIYTQGSFVLDNAELSIPLNSPLKTELAWYKGFWLKITTPIYNEQNKTIGQFIGEVPLPEVTKEYTDYRGIGSTGEIAVCAPWAKSHAKCFPMRFSSNAFITPLLINGRFIPVNYAFQNQADVIHSVDYKKQNVIAAFAPIDAFGLGMVVKINSAEIYKSINNQLNFLLPIAIILIFGGLILLYWRVLPLVNKVVASEQNAKETSLQLTKSLNQLSRRNAEISTLRELSANLQSCVNLTEAAKLISKALPYLFPRSSGILYLMNSSHSLESVLSFGNPDQSTPVFKRDQCWAIRKGHLYRVQDPKTDLVCEHINSSKNIIHECLPLIVQSEVIGLLYLETIKNDATDPAENNSRLLLATTLSAQLALGISNIRLREKLQEQSTHDPLTGLYNRRYLDDNLERELIRANRENFPVTVLMIDIDYFKHYNDTYGHEMGDSILKEIGTLIKQCIRSYDFASRFGGEEFIFIMPNTTEEVAIKRAKELHEIVKNIPMQLGLKDKLNISIGIAEYPNHARNAHDLIAAADAALYHAKETGRNRTVLYSKDLFTGK